MAEADVYLGRAFHTRHYGYWKYTYDLMGLGVALAKDETYKKFSRYASSTFYSKLSKNRAKRDLRDRVATKMGARLHTSRKVAIENFPYFEIMFQGDDLARELAEYFDLDDAEVKQFRSRKIKKKKVKKVTKTKKPSETKKAAKESTPSTKSLSSSKTSETVTDNEKVTGKERRSKDTASSAKKVSKAKDSKSSVTPKDPKTSTKNTKPRKRKSTPSESAESGDKDDSGKSESKEKGNPNSLFSFQ